MRTSPLHIACTRRLDPGLKATALAKGVELQDVDLLNYEYLDTPAIRSTLAVNTAPLVLTSRHALRALAALSVNTSGQACFCTSGRTATLAEAAGLACLAKAPSAAALAAPIQAARVPKVLHLSANVRRRELEEALQQTGIAVQVLEIYRKELLRKKLTDFQGILFFSPSQIEAFRLENRLDVHTPAFCIGPTTAAQLQAYGHQQIIQAVEPSAAAVLEQVYQYFKLNQ
ncbi:MAG: uroporphyrinogen-III synthase [Phaeodactylibacter sp.]|nr:uroporphyrinogen-III synthase [Phaeodactylibacter sp.]